MKARILIVEDHPPLARAMRRVLLADGYGVEWVSSGAEFWRHYRAQGADLVLLDLNLGAEDGMDIARDLVANTPVAVIMVTARGETEDRIQGLDTGADDYLVKPVVLDELRARIRAVLRRHFGAGEERLQIGPAILMLAAQTLLCEESARSLELTAAETKILAHLMRRVGRAVDRDTLLDGHVWEPGNRTADVHVGHIRAKLRAAGIGCLSIRPVRGIGYRLDTVTP
jgi:DNA-binding response OmpR family regulator